jgi:hypothetical protein
MHFRSIIFSSTAGAHLEPCSGTRVFRTRPLAAAALLPARPRYAPAALGLLATERREESLAWLQGPMSGVAGLTAALMAATSHLTFRANMRAGGLEEVPFFVCLSVYLAGTFWLVFRILRRFGTVPVPSGENMASG